MIPMTLNGLAVLSVRLFLFWKGAWVADCDLDTLTPALAPSSGPAVLVVGGCTLTGTIDPRASGTFQSKAVARVVGGRGAWDHVVPRQDFFSDAGVLSTTVYAGTGALVGETVVDLVPSVLGAHAVRYGGPAHEVFGAVDWWVDLTGVTNVGPRPPALADTSLTISDFDPADQRLDFSCDALLLPNTTLLDARFNGSTPIVRDVEQVFDHDGSHGVAWCSSKPVTRLLSALENLVVHAAGRMFTRSYRYRLVLYQGMRPCFQAVTPTAGVPDLVPVDPWGGLAGLTQTLAPSQEVLITFDFANPASPQPITVSYSGAGNPLRTTIDASVEVAIGPSAPLVALAGGAQPVALAPALTTFLGALQTWSAAVAGALSTAGFPIAGPQSALVDAIRSAQSATPAVKVKAT